MKREPSFNQISPRLHITLTNMKYPHYAYLEFKTVILARSNSEFIDYHRVLSCLNRKFILMISFKKGC